MHNLLSTLLLAVGLTFAPLPLPAAEMAAPATIEVTGRGLVQTRPDIAILSFTIETSAAEADDAIRRNADQAAKLIATLKQKMDAGDRIATTQFQLFPVYDQKTRISPASYRVSNRVRLETARVDDLGPLIDAAAAAGSNRIGQLRFTHSQNDELARKAAALAVADARRTADELARAAGVTITRLHRIRFAAAHDPTPLPSEMAMAARATPIEVSSLNIERQVTVVYAVE
jgi:uncharacterized protein YggE